MAGELTHTASKERMVPKLMFLSERMLQLLITDWKVKSPLRFAFNCVQPLIQHYKQDKQGKVPLQSIQSP